MSDLVAARWQTLLPIPCEGGQLISESLAPRDGEGARGYWITPEFFKRTTLHPAVAGVSNLLNPVLTWDPSTSVYDQSLCKPLWAPILTWTGGSVVSSPTSNKACMAWLRGGYRADVWNVGVYSRTAFAVPSSPSPGGAKTGRLALPAHREFANGPTSERRTTSSDNRVFDLLRGSMSYKTHNLNVQT